MNTILVTRPVSAGQELCQQLKALKISAIHFPAVAIVPLKIDLQAAKNIIYQAEIIIFTSPNAVEYGAALIADNNQAKIVAIGSGTAKALQNKKINVNIVPELFNSESLLVTAVFQEIKNKNIVLIKGQGGRELLSTEVDRRGARLSTIDVYLRNCPQQKLNSKILNQIDLIVVTSCEVLENLLLMTPVELQPQLRDKQLLVTSSRIAKKARDLDFKPPPLLAKNAMNQTILALIKDTLLK